jgi:hypothetical protein
MTEMHWMLLAASLAAVLVVVGLLARRRGSPRRQLRLMLGTGAGMGGALLVALAIQAS